MNNQMNGQSQPVQQNVSNGGKSNLKLFIIIGSIVATLLIIIVCMIMLFPSSKSVANKYLSGYKARNVNKVISTLHPNIKKEEKEDIKDSFEEMKEEKFVIKSAKLDSDYEKIDEDDDEFDYYVDYLDSYDIDEDSVKEIRVYEAEVKFSYDGETDEEEMNVVVAKIGMKWYVIR